MIIKSGTPQLQDKACSLLIQGHVVAIPTETVYGLAADAYNDDAIAQIYHVKNRPEFNPLIIHYATFPAAVQDVEVNEWAERLAEQFWPGPLTLVLPRRVTSQVSLLASAGLSSLAIRIPQHEVARRLIHHYGRPLAAPSANLSNTISPTSAEDVYASLGNRVPLIIDGGHCSVGLESSIVDLTGEKPRLLRPGGITVEQMEECLQLSLSHSEKEGTIKAPGMLKRHYAPSIPVRLNADAPEDGEAYLGFAHHHHGNYTLSASGNLLEAAAQLFRLMRQLDNPKNQGIAVAPIPHHGLGLAINDRLQRAAHRGEEA